MSVREAAAAARVSRSRAGWSGSRSSGPMTWPRGSGWPTPLEPNLYFEPAVLAVAAREMGGGREVMAVVVALGARWIAFLPFESVPRNRLWPLRHASLDGPFIERFAALRARSWTPPGRRPPSSRSSSRSTGNGACSATPSTCPSCGARAGSRPCCWRPSPGTGSPSANGT
ncbi:hypothetical protein NKG05_19895 [Oerskovia sp. M15]